MTGTVGMDTKAGVRPAWLFRAAGVVVLLSALAGGGSAARDAKPHQLANGVEDWWVMNGGRTLVVRKEDHFHSCPAAAGNLKLLRDVSRVRRCRKLSEKIIGCEVRGGYALLNVAAGRAAVVATGPGRFDTFGLKPGRDAFVLMRSRSDPADFTFFRVDPAAAKAVEVFRTKDKCAYPFIRVSDDGRRLILATPSPKADTMVQRTINLQTRKVTTKSVTRRLAQFPPGPTKTYPLKQPSRRIVEKDGQVWMQIGTNMMDLFQGPGRAWCIPDRTESPTHLAVGRIVDTNKDGMIAREGGDWIEIWIVDLASGTRLRIADTTQENITRRWSPGGKYFVYNRIVVGPGKAQWRGDLVLFRKANNQPMRFQPGPNTDYVSLRGFAGENRVLISYDQLGRGRDAKTFSQFALLELGPNPAIRLVGPAFRTRVACALAGSVMIYAVHDPKTQTDDLFRFRLPPASPAGRPKH